MRIGVRLPSSSTARASSARFSSLPVPRACPRCAALLRSHLLRDKGHGSPGAIVSAETRAFSISAQKAFAPFRPRPLPSPQRAAASSIGVPPLSATDLIPESATAPIPRRAR